MHPSRIKPFLLSVFLITIFWLLAAAANAQTLYEIKPRIIIVFDTSGSMVFNFAGDNTRGDGTNELWSNGRHCCPGALNGGGTASRLYAAKNAMTQMLNASGEIEFGLLKFNQNYSDAGYTADWYRYNQTSTGYDVIKYDGTNTFSDWRNYLVVGFGDYATPGTSNLSLWRDVNTENDRSEVAMWMDHHKFQSGNGVTDSSTFPGPWNDYLEQELRGDGGTPLAEALVEARSYLNLLRDPTDGLDDYRSCRKYTVVILTDGDANTDPVSEVTDLYSDGIDSWVIGLAYSSTTLNSMATAGGRHYDPNNYGSAFTANSQEALTAALFYIVSESLAFEECNYLDDDCDGDIDEGVIGPWCDVHDVLNTSTPWVDTDSTAYSNPNYTLVCTDPGETICDGIDDNCDGQIDEAPADGAWSANEDPDFGQPCVDTDAPAYIQTQFTDSDAVLAPCNVGTWACIQGGDGKTCVNYIGPNVEQCDGVDNDCDGLIDEADDSDMNNYGLEGDTCGNAQGECTPGVMTCVDSSGWQCVGGSSGTTETCNGLDDNCNGDTDETYPEAGESCYSAGDGGCDSDGTNCKGICVGGVRNCVNGVLGCAGEESAAADDSVCNGLDDDCDGTDDEDVVEGTICPSGADAWVVGGTSLCNRGTLQCQAESGMVCVGDGASPVVKPAVEVCDGYNNDCDTEVDEGLYGACGGCVVGVDTEWDCIDTDPGAGECRVGVGECDPDNSTPGSPVYINCVNSQGPTAETCNGKDDDCDGQIDESADLQDASIGDYCYPDGLSGCDSPDPDTGGACDGECALGQIACVNGAITCSGYTAPVSEGAVCDNLDNNCNNQIDEGIVDACGDPIDTDSAFPGAAYGQGECAYGIRYCSPDTDSEDPATWGPCQGARGPSRELCNGLDDDCDGIYEDSEADDLLANAQSSFVGEACGSCDGIYECVRNDAIDLDEIGAYELVCAGGEVQTEVCNGLDENCNDIADDGVAPVSCGGCEFGVDTDWDCINGQPAAGECEVGYDYCIDGSYTTECYGSVKPVLETCDGLDNDCDGLTDEDFDSVVVCQEAVGECPQGVLKCTELNGELGLNCCDADRWNTFGICEVPTVSQLEVCDGLDNDCDGLVDEDIAQVGAPCGSYLGVCEPGVYKCVETGSTDAPAINGFEIICDGGTGGTTEECNNLDDDCDGLVDEEIPSGDTCSRAPNWMVDPALQTQYPDGIGECTVGNYECVAGDWVCNVPGPTDEVCDGLDNDCDGLVDENEEVECPMEGSSCIEGTCAEPCGDGEFQCPAGKECTDLGNGSRGCISTLCDVSRPDALPCAFNEYYCTPGMGFEPPCRCDTLSALCVDVCYSKVCPEGSVCVAADGGRCHEINTGEGCMTDGCDDGQVCVPIAMCTAEPCEECVNDPCADVTCEEDQYCNTGGVCVNTCAEVTCPEGQGCRDGVCVTDDPCAGVICTTGVLCNTATGKCDTSLTNPCKGVACEFYEVCRDGDCVFDTCTNVVCPNGTVCVDGSCYADGGFIAGNIDSDSSDTSSGARDSDSADTDSNNENGSDDSGATATDTGTAPINYEGIDRVLSTGAGGCMCSVAPGAAPTNHSAWILMLLAGGMVMLRRWRKRPQKTVNPGFTAMVFLVALFLFGCQVDPFEFEGADDGTENGHASTSGGGTDSNTDTSPGTNDSSSSDSSLNGTDSNSLSTDSDTTDTSGGCDECSTDETCCTNASGIGFCANLTTNPFNCGECNNVCSMSHASATCVAGVCAMQACETYWHDQNSDIEDGCEHYCKPTADKEDNGDICDGIATSADPNNDNYTPQDNDCDFEFDEDVDFMTDPKNCGYCGNVCLFNHASATCVAGVCTMAACDAHWYDKANGATDGCEYYCDGSPDEEEVCDFVDNNCDGNVDESDPNAGAACYPAGSSGCSEPYGDTDCSGICSAGTITCADGALRCTGYQLPELEVCDGMDNNCNGLIDEFLSISCGGASGANPDEGACQSGLAPCISAALGTSEAVYDTDTGCVGAVSSGLERCDGYDNDCDGLTDEVASEDANGNNIEVNDSRLNVACGLGACAAYTTQCVGGAISCADFSVPATDTPCNNVDDDCDGIVDEVETYLCGGSNGYPCNDTDNGCDPYSEGVCQAGTFTCNDTEMICSGDVKPNASDTEHLDICDNLDNDCDGLVDEDAFYADTDSDRSCGPPCNDGELQCVDGTITCVGQTTPTPDLCDSAGADEDCNPATPNGAGEATYYQSCDGTDAGECEEGFYVCGPSGMYCNEVGGDDIEICDGVDNDCDGLIDGADSDMVIETPASLACDSCPGTTTAVCTGSGGWKCRYDSDAGVDCGSDTDCYTHASAETACDGVDNDCDGVIDDDFQMNNNVLHCGACNFACASLLADTDNAPNVAEYYCSGGTCRIKSCTDTDRYFNINGVDSDGCECEVNAVCDTDSECDKCSGGSLIDVDDDCDGVADEDASAEICDNIDNDCDGQIDEGLTYPGYCEPLCPSGMSSAATCVSGNWVCNYTCGVGGLECDTDSAPHPSVPEAVCDGIDGNCDGVVDESFFESTDTDPLGGSCSNASLSPVGGCLRSGKYLCDNTGTATVCCDPFNPSTTVCDPTHEINLVDSDFHAESSELSIPNGVDDDCDGTVDEEANGAVDYVRVQYVNSANITLYFDMFKYEASRGDATLSDAGDVSTTACSQPDVMPWAYVNFADARAACQLLNASDCATTEGCWDLCTVQQWEYACMDGGASSTTYPYGDPYAPLTCNGRDYGIANSDIATRAAAQLSTCSAEWPVVSPAVEADVMDLSGNLEEWTATASILGTGTTLYDIRGGSYNDLASGLTCDFDFSAADGSATNYRLENLGFRCCRMYMACTTSDECPDNFWCNGGTCEEAKTDANCGSEGVACAADERCAGSLKGCQSCTSNYFCGTGCVACESDERCNGTSCVSCTSDTYCGDGCVGCTGGTHCSDSGGGVYTCN
jgi:hypothetical protein